MDDETRIRKFVEKKLEERNGLLIHAVAYGAVNLLVFLIWLMTSISSASLVFPWFLFVLLPWGIGMYAHYMDYSNKFGRGRDRREQLIQQEIERERARSDYGGSYGKAKNDDRYYAYEDERSVRLTEDGELSDSSVDELKRQRR